tara:strand:- start:634 stop:1428 length:795 start_codon:yes stop_codon:yes gene_type:complete
MSKYVCEDCGKEYKTRAGLWKHQKRYKHGKFAEAETEAETVAEAAAPDPAEKETAVAKAENIPIDESPAEDPDTSVSPSAPTEEDSTSDGDSAGGTSSWRDFQFTAADTETTDAIPTHFKMAVAGGGKKGKLSKAEKEALIKRNTAILKLGLTTTDHLLTKYAQAVCLDETMEIKHSDSDKDLVANAQMAYLEEKGLFLTNYLSTGVVAASLTGWYIGAPLVRIRKNSKRKLIKGRLLSKLPLIGRFFKKKNKIETTELRIHEQ